MPQLTTQVAVILAIRARRVRGLTRTRYVCLECALCQGMGVIREERDPVDLHRTWFRPIPFGDVKPNDFICWKCEGTGHVVQEEEVMEEAV